MRRVAAVRTALAILGAVSALAVLAPVAAAATMVNGDFESGSLEGWQVEAPDSGTWSAFGGTEAPASKNPVPPPFAGNFAAFADDPEPSSMILYQDVPLAAGETHQLSLELNYKSNLPIVIPSPNILELVPAPGEGEEEEKGAEPNQQVRVDVMKPGLPVNSLSPGDVLETVFATEEGDPQEIGWTHLEADLTPFAGQTVRIRVAVVASQDYVNAGVDAVSIASTPGAGPETPTSVSPGPAPVPASTTFPTVTAAPAQCIAPKLKGLKLKAAKRAIRAASCGVGHVGRKRSLPAGTGTVIRQSPWPGTPTAVGSKIAVKLG